MTIDSIGFVGTGAITEAMVRGLLATPAYAGKVHLSPRSADISARLAADFETASVARDNQAVVDQSDVVVLAVRPQIAKEVIEPLSFRDGQSVVSVIAATERQTLLEWIGADVHLVQAIPLPFVEDRIGVTAIFPRDVETAALFDALGSAVQCESKKEYDLLAAASALMSTYFHILDAATDWLEDNGLDRSKGQAYLAPLFHGLAERAKKSRTSSFGELSREFATKGGLNEQVQVDFDKDGGTTALKQALDRVFARITG